MSEEQIRQIYSEVIFERGLDYFNEGRVSNAIKLKDKMFGEVVGTDRYRTEVDLDSLESKCSCPYGRNCKHGVALLLQYFNGEYVDGDEIMKRLEGMGIEELMKVIEKLIAINPANLLYLGIYPAAGEQISEKRVESLDKEIKSRLQSIEYGYADYEFVDGFSKFIKANEDALTKEQIFYMLEFLIKHCEDYGYFYDDYSDSYFGDPIFESLCDAFAKKELENKDFDKLDRLDEIDNYDMLGPFLNRLAAVENAAKLKDFDSRINEFLEGHSYVEFLINSGLVEKAERLIETDVSLGDESRFRLYLRIDRGAAIEFARRNGFYPSLMRYYHETGAHDETVSLFREVVSDRAKREQLKDDIYLFRDIYDSINKSGKEERLEDVLRSLFAICYSHKYYGLCVDTGIKLGDKELLRKLIDKKTGYGFDVESKIKLLEYLKGEYRQEVAKELKAFAESLIGEMGNYAYQRAAECAFMLKEMVSKEEWREFVKTLYRAHSRKINLWNKFKERGVYLKLTKGVVSMEERR